MGVRPPVGWLATPRAWLSQVWPALLLGLLLVEFCLALWWVAVHENRYSRYASWDQPAGLVLSSLRAWPTLVCLLPCCWLAWHKLRRMGLPAVPRRSPALWVALACWLTLQVAWPIASTLGVRWPGAPLVWLSLAFKLAALMALYGALAHRPPVAEAPKLGLSLRMLIVVAITLKPLLPMGYLVQRLARWLGWLEPTGMGLAILAIESLSALALAWGLMVAARRGGLLNEERYPRAARYGFRIWIIYLALVPIGFVLSAIPYGGGGVPKELRWLVIVVQVLGLMALATMCRREPPTDERRAST